MTTMHNRQRLHFFDDTQQPPPAEAATEVGSEPDTLRERVRADYEEAIKEPSWLYPVAALVVAIVSFIGYALQVAPGMVR